MQTNPGTPSSMTSVVLLIGFFLGVTGICSFGQQKLYRNDAAATRGGGVNVNSGLPRYVTTRFPPNTSSTNSSTVSIVGETFTFSSTNGATVEPPGSGTNVVYVVFPCATNKTIGSMTVRLTYASPDPIGKLTGHNFFIGKSEVNPFQFLNTKYPDREIVTPNTALTNPVTITVSESSFTPAYVPLFAYYQTATNLNASVAGDNATIFSTLAGKESGGEWTLKIENNGLSPINFSNVTVSITTPSSTLVITTPGGGTRTVNLTPRRISESTPHGADGSFRPSRRQSER